MKREDIETQIAELKLDDDVAKAVGPIIDAVLDDLEAAQADVTKAAEDATKAATEATEAATKAADETKKALDAETKRADEAERATKIAKGEDPDKKTEPITKAGMTEEQVTQVEALEKEGETGRKRIAKLEEANLDADLNKRLDELKFLPGDRADHLAVLKGASEEHRETLFKTLTSANEAAKAGEALLKETGRGGGGDGEAITEVATAVGELRKADPKLTEHVARAQVLKAATPELRKQYNEERRAAN